MNFQEAMAFIQSFPDMERATFGARGPTMGLPSMKSLLARLGDPHKGTSTIHVAGSKGKGSTSTFIAAILSEAGLHTALYTSPHLHSYLERFAFDMVAISEETFARGTSEIQDLVRAEQAAGNTTISTFGVLTALFFHLVKTAPKKVDWQVVEVGLGGRYDVTNVFESKAAAVITPISLEHVEILGSTQTEIAANKAGIVVPHCLTILAPQLDPGARIAVGRRVHEVDAELIDVAKKYKQKILLQDKGGQSFVMEGPNGPLELHIKMLGNHQISNAATAVATIWGLQHKGLLEVSDEAIARGLDKAMLRGRFEVIESKGRTFVADGAHNHESAEALAKALKLNYPGRKCIFVIGVNNDKNISAIWKELVPLGKSVIATRSDNPRSMDPSQIAELLSDAGSVQGNPDITQSVPEAIERAYSVAQPEDIICITGSLYVVAEARQCLLATNQAEATALAFRP
jgi:dihydrofolate synthase / folylpolyglutamate synthase